MVVVDTDVLVDYLRGKTRALAELEEIGFSRVLISAFTWMEIYRGVLDKREKQRFDREMPQFSVVQITEPVSRQAQRWMHDYCLSHQPVDIPDLVNAAIGALSGLPVHTYNKGDYRYLPGVTLWQSNIG